MGINATQSADSEKGMVINMSEILRIKNISKSFDNNIILDNVELGVNKGEVLVIVGPSGCGKSTKEKQG